MGGDIFSNLEFAGSNSIKFILFKNINARRK